MHYKCQCIIPLPYETRITCFLIKYSCITCGKSISIYENKLKYKEKKGQSHNY